jgi:diaminohydroxyphosphoribosylaminopyrimidine deaminase/5-amino-6-(5-phosphoribosylamino)uracil reductase
VVVASDDPTEKASGRGLGILRDEGVDVVVADGELAGRARCLNQAVPQARTDRPARRCCSSPR